MKDTRTDKGKGRNVRIYFARSSILLNGPLVYAGMHLSSTAAHGYSGLLRVTYGAEQAVKLIANLNVNRN